MTDHTPSILVGIDGSAGGREALSLATALAVLTGSTLILGSVYSYESGKFGALVWPPHHDADSWLADCEKQIADSGIPWRSCTVPATSVAEGLVLLAQREAADAIVLGSSRHGTIGRVLAGSTVRRVVHGAPCAVAVAPHEWRPLAPDAPVAVGVAFAGTPESHEALILAADLAGAVHAPLDVLTVVQLPSRAHPMFAATGISHASWLDERRRDAEESARSAVADVAPEPGAEITVLDGDPVERLAEASERLDLLVLGSRRFGPLRTTLLGGVSSPLIERAACPLVIVPRGVHGQPEDPQTARSVAHA